MEKVISDGQQLDFSKDIILEDDVVLLSPLKEEDYSYLLPFALQEPEIWKYSLVPAAGAEGMRKYIALAIEGRHSRKEYPFVVFDKRTNQYAGSTRFYDIQLHHSTLQLGYTWYGKAFQQTGLNQHCKYRLLQFAFETMQMKRVEFRADNNNARSITAMKKIGCTVEGVLRSNCATPGGARRDSIVLSILQNEWFDTVKKNLGRRIGILNV